MPATQTTIDIADDLSRYTEAQLLTMNLAIEVELARLMQDEQSMTDEQKRKWFEACEFMTRCGAEILRRRALPSPGPTAVCWESMPDGSSPVRLSFSVMAF
jgi:hypothetical protein